MIKLNSRFRSVAAGLLVALVSAAFVSPTNAQDHSPGLPGERGVKQASRSGLQALSEGKPELANEISTAILARNPEDAEALFVRALLLKAVNLPDAARDASAAAWRHAKTPALKFDAAMLTADILSGQGYFTRAQFWLRRADQAAFDDARRQAVSAAFRSVRRKNPLQVTLRFSVRPSNNVNNGADTEIIDIGGLPFRIDASGRQFGGWIAETGVSLRYRLASTPKARTDFLGELAFRKVWLETGVAELAPEVRNSDYDYGVVAAGFRHQRLIWPKLGPSAVTAIAGQSWYGGAALSRWSELQLLQSVTLTRTSALRFGISGRAEKRLDESINSSTSLKASVDYLEALGTSGGYSLGLWIRNYWSDSATVDGVALGFNASRAFGQIGPVALQVSMKAETRDFQAWSLTAGGREDRTLSLKLDMKWPDLSYYGFVPQASLQARRTWSNVDLYDRDEVSIGLAAVSRF